MIYHEMENMHLSKYDRPSESDRRSWGNFDFLACLVYQCIRDLARPDHAFAGIFDRKALRIETGRNKAARREAGRKEASTCILGVIKLACNLIISYTSPSPDDIVKLIEETMPALRPEFSPIREVRTKAQLTKMGVDELRRMVLGGDRRGIDEKEWLVNILLKKDPRLETWATGEEAAGGIKRPIEVEDDEPTKKARTESAQANDLGEG
ncbi:hypothetical protein GQ44DRAFT_704451 [Phaeosphaeriaceae sp. PMI808]|nr:hypothetical protein GQ44DRAFT_704451 [Phaeosphaeriaceae sp. PMI808]